jgi:hypothetical protein
VLLGDSQRDPVEGVSDTKRGTNQRLTPVAVVKNAAQLLDDSRQGGVGHKRAGPHLFVKLGFCDDSRCGGYQNGQQLERLERDVEGLVLCVEQQPPIRIEGECRVSRNHIWVPERQPIIHHLSPVCLTTGPATRFPHSTFGGEIVWRQTNAPAHCEIHRKRRQDQRAEAWSSAETANSTSLPRRVSVQVELAHPNATVSRSNNRADPFGYGDSDGCPS